MQILPFSYMAWAKSHYFGPGLSLIPSGIAPPPPELLTLPEVAQPLAEVVAEGPGTLQQDIADAYGCRIEETLVTVGSTLANVMVFMAYVDPGDDVVIEDPAYTLFECIATTRGASVRSLVRSRDRDFDLLPERVAEALLPNTKLCVFTSVHNPTGRLASVERLRAIGDLLQANGTLGLVSDCYLDFVEGSVTGEAGQPPTRPVTYRVHPSFLSSNSLTKAYGLGSARLGWVFGTPERIERLSVIRNIISPVLSAMPVHIARAALANRNPILARARAASARGHALLHTEIDDGFELVPPEAGIIATVRVKGVDDCHAFAEYLRGEHDLGVVPGEFFGLNGWLRLGVGGPEEHVRDALRALCAGRRAYLGQA